MLYALQQAAFRVITYTSTVTQYSGSSNDLFISLASDHQP